MGVPDLNLFKHSDFRIGNVVSVSFIIKRSAYIFYSYLFTFNCYFYKKILSFVYYVRIRTNCYKLEEFYRSLLFTLFFSLLFTI